MGSPTLALPPGAELVDTSGIKLPPGAELVTNSKQPIQQKTAAGYSYDPKTLGPNPYSDKAVVKAIPSTLPVIGGMVGDVPGAGLGSAAAVELRNEFPKLFGQGPQSGAGAAGQIGLDTFTQGALPSAIGQILNKTGLANLISSKFLSSFPSVKEGASKVISDQILGRYQFPETGIVESAAANAANTKDELLGAYKEATQAHMASDAYIKDPNSISPEMEAAMEEHSNTFGKNTVGNQLVTLQHQFEQGGDVAGNQTYKQIANTALSDVQHVRNWKIATGEPQTVEQLALNDLVTNGFKDSTGKLDAAGILDKLGGTKKEIYSEAISPEKLATFKEFLGQLQDQEKENTTGMVVNFSKRHLLWAGAGLTSGTIGVLTGHEGFGALGLGVGAAAGGMVLTNSMLGRMMADPEMAQLVVKAMKTPINAPEAGLVNQALQTGARMMGIGIHNAINPSVPSSQSSQPQ